MKSTNAVPLPEKELKRFDSAAARALMMTTAWRPGRRVVAAVKKDISPDEERTVDTNSAAPVQQIRLGEVALQVGGDQNLFDEDGLHLLHVLRRGLMIGMCVSEHYQKAVGLDELIRSKNQDHLPAERVAEFQQKNQAAAAAQLFAAASYTLWRLSSYKTEKVSATPMELAWTPELSLLQPPEAVQCFVFYLAKVLEATATNGQRVVQNGPGAIKMAQLYLQWVINEIKLKVPSLQYTEAFTSIVYQPENDEFVVNGFEQASGTAVQARVEFKRVEAKNIVGNHEMKRKLLQLAQMLLAYDFKRKMNPFLELEAMTWLGVLQGWAGTGKSMGLGFLQTILFDLCEALGIPFIIRPIPNAIISSLQGESAKAYEAWWRGCFDPNYLCCAPVDDSEAVYLDRRAQSSSEGSKLVVMSHLRLTEGSTAFNYGNVLQPHATNNADMIDAPVFSRYQFRILVPGAESRNDYADQMKIWGDGFNKKTGSDVIRLEFPGDYTFLADQGLMSKAEREVKAEGFSGFKDKGLQELWEQVERKKLSPNSYDLYGTFFAALHKKYEQFTSRDVRNITANTAARLFGFEFDPTWLENRDAFVAKDYDTKKKMIIDAALQYQKGLTVEQVLFQETTNYVESTIKMLDSGRQFRIKQMADDLEERNEAAALVGQRRQRPLEAAE